MNTLPVGHAKILIRSMNALSNSDVFGKMSKVTLFSSKTSVYKPEMNTPCIQLQHRQRSDFFPVSVTSDAIPIFLIRCQVKFGKRAFILSLEKIFYTKNSRAGLLFFFYWTGLETQSYLKLENFRLVESVGVGTHTGF